MPGNQTATFLKKLREREERHLLRELHLPAGVDFCSNDYLGYSGDTILRAKIETAMKGVPAGSSGSRLLRGHQHWHVQLESALAHWCGREDALFFPSGYQANLGLLSSVLGADTIVFSDENNHASIIDGIKLSGSDKRIFKHNDVADLEKVLQEAPADKNKIIVVESLYSMKGDKAPLKEIHDLCLLHNAQLIVDEAHATGVYGSGLVQKLGLNAQVLATVHSAGKALGVAGAWIACDHAMKQFFINFARPFIYSTAPSPLAAVVLTIAVEHWGENGETRAQLALDKAQSFIKQLKVFLIDEMITGDGPIVYLNLGDSQKAIEWADYFQAKGYDVRPIRYPTVPENQAGVRISIHADHADADIKFLVNVVKEMVLEC